MVRWIPCFTQLYLNFEVAINFVEEEVKAVELPTRNTRSRPAKHSPRPAMSLLKWERK